MNTLIPSMQSKLAIQLVDEAARCVSCGLCLPHCPTYRKTMSEADSPRGRIVLMQGLLEQRIPANERFLSHMDLCLTCRACESVCPNNVAYGRLINGVRGLVEKSRRRAMWQRWVRYSLIDGVVTRLWAMRCVSGALRAWQATLGKVTGTTGSGLVGVASNLPLLKPQPVWKEVYPATGKIRGEVGLFLGCVARITDVDTLTATIFVLNRLGYTVHVPPQQGCCGAMHVSLGEPEKALLLEGKNIQAFAGLKLDALISTVTGCCAVLKDYPQNFSGKVKDISEFLLEAEGWGGVELMPLEAVVVVHDHCLMRNVLHCQDMPYDLLRRIPGVTVAPLARNAQCCGAAGTYFLTQPEMAASLLADKIEAVKASGAQIIATSNIGCAMHLAMGLKAAGHDVVVLHPITLLARQMGFNDDKN